MGAITAVFLDGEGKIRFTGAPRIELPVPDEPATLPADQGRGIDSAPVRSLIAPPVPELLEQGAFGALPRIGADGRRPFFAYARPFDLDDRRPKVAIVILGLGLQAELTDLALTLPGEISLQFSPYASDLPALFERARGAGHEILLDLPMEPEDYPASDPGPHTLLAGGSAEDNEKRLAWVLARAPGYVAVAGSGARFTTSRAAAPVLDVLSRRGLALIEVGSRHLAETAVAVGLPYASATVVIDEDPSTLAIDYALAALEEEALRTGSALGVALGYPVSLDRLRRWAGSLAGKGLVLAPASALVVEKSGLSIEVRSDGTRHGRQG